MYNPFFKRANRVYIPGWMYIVQAIIDIIDGVVSLFVVPFGYSFSLGGSWAGYMLRHSGIAQLRKKCGVSRYTPPTPPYTQE